MSVGSVISAIFAVVSIAVLFFFLHKVAWLVRYKRLQRRLIDAATAKLEESSRGALPAWEAFTQAAWQHGYGVPTPEGFVADVTARVEAVLAALGDKTPTGPLLQQAIAEEGVAATILRVPLTSGGEAVATLSLSPPAVVAPEAPPAAVYQLDVRSRYSFWRRALVFVTGLADVVYSSQHIAKMSQYTHVSLGTILRRLSLVMVLALGIVLEVIVGLRAELEQLLDAHVIRHWAYLQRSAPASLRDNAASLLALIIWTGMVAGAYFGLFFVIRRKSKQNLAVLERLKDEQPARLEEISRTHGAVLDRWTHEYGKTLDSAVVLTARHIELLGHHNLARVRHRLRSQALLDVGKRIGDALFALLPEAEGKLQDQVTTKERSWGHAFWPRAAEMRDVVEQAKYREAWQSIELALGELRRGSPEPSQVAELWRQLVVYATTFAAVLPADAMGLLQRAYNHMVGEAVAGARGDLERYDQTIRELVGNLSQQLAASAPLVDARVELTNQRMAADAAKFHAEIIRAREAARLEAMAFEI